MAVVGAIAVPHPPLIVPAVGRGDEARIQAECDVELAREIVERANAAGIVCADSARYRDDMTKGDQKGTVPFWSFR